MASLVKRHHSRRRNRAKLYQKRDFTNPKLQTEPILQSRNHDSSRPLVTIASIDPQVSSQIYPTVLKQKGGKKESRHVTLGSRDNIWRSRMRGNIVNRCFNRLAFGLSILRQQAIQDGDRNIRKT